MSLSLDSSIRDLTDCGCCEGIAARTPAAVTNRAGLSAIAYRTGAHSTFKASMLADLSAGRSPALRNLTTRDDDDFSIALIDAWATTLDVLTFYQERIAHESYLRTATERLSLLQLARQIGYELGPGVAASTALAFTIEDAPGSPPVVALQPGVKVQSVPGPGEQPQTFETTEAIEARAEWNAIRPRLTQPKPLTATMSEVWLAGTDANLKKGDRLLVVAPKAGGGVTRTLRRIANVVADNESQRTQVALEPQPFYLGTTESPSMAQTGVWAMRAKAAPFGHSAPQKASITTSGNTSTTSYSEWPLVEPLNNRITLDAVYDQITAGSFVVIDRPVLFFLFRWLIFAQATNVRTASPAKYGTASRATELTLDVNWLRFVSLTWPGFSWTEPDALLNVLRETTVYVQSEPLALAEAPITTAVQGNTIVLGVATDGLVKGMKVAVSGMLTSGQAASEIAVVESMATSGGITTLALQNNLATAYVRESVTINANVAAATHGETVSEVLGSGDASKPFQRFTLRQSPLTYVSSSDPSGGDSTLQVRVNDVLWTEAPSLYARKPGERIYVARIDDAGKTTVQFGDGVAGARPASGADNIRAAYRKGIGAAGNVQAGRLTLLMTRPLGVKGVINPDEATGGADGESRDDARRNAPLTVLTLDRVVSLQDYEDFARAFAGIAKALATWTWDGQTRGVFITVAGIGGAEVKPTSATHIHLAQAMRDAGDPHVALQIKSFAKKLFRVNAQVTKAPDHLTEQVQARVEAALKSHFAFDAREFGQRVALSEVMAVIQQVGGVRGVDVNALYRTDFVGGDGLKQPLPVALPQAGSDGDVAPAELLVLDETGLVITVV